MATKTRVERKESVRADNSLQTVKVPARQLICSAKDNPRFAGHKDPEKAAKAFLRSEDFAAMTRSFDKLGIQEPLLAERVGKDEYRVNNGWCRAQYAKNKKIDVPVVIMKPKDDVHRITIQIALNTARRSYDPIAKAHAFKRLVEAWGSEAAAARHCGVSITSLRESLSLLDLPQRAQRLLSETKLTTMAAERIMKFPGWKSWRAADAVADDPKKDVGEEVAAEAGRFEDHLNFVLDAVEKKDDRISYEELAQTWNKYKEADAEEEAAEDRPKKKSKSKKSRREEPEADESEGETAKEDDEDQDEDDAKGRQRDSGRGGRGGRTDNLTTILPTDDSVREALEYYGLGIADEIVNDSGDEDVVKTLTDRIEHIAAVMGWCVPKDLREILVNKSGEPLYDEDVATALCRETVAEFTLLGLLQVRGSKGMILTKDDALNDANNQAWTAFYKQDKPLRTLIQELDKRLVQVRKGAAA